jgi:hypothetical protein
MAFKTAKEIKLTSFNFLDELDSTQSDQEATISFKTSFSLIDFASDPTSNSPQKMILIG